MRRRRGGAEEEQRRRGGAEQERKRRQRHYLHNEVVDLGLVARGLPGGQGALGLRRARRRLRQLSFRARALQERHKRSLLEQGFAFGCDEIHSCSGEYPELSDDASIRRLPAGCSGSGSLRLRRLLQRLRGFHFGSSCFDLLRKPHLKIVDAVRLMMRCGSVPRSSGRVVARQQVGLGVAAGLHDEKGQHREAIKGLDVEGCRPSWAWPVPAAIHLN